MSRLYRLCALLSLLAVTACNTGAVGFGEAACSTSSALLTQVSGECKRSIESLDEVENESVTITTPDVAPFATVDWQATVESGRVEVKFTDFRGNEQLTEVTPDNPGSGSVRVQLDPLNRINFTLTPLDGTAEGVEYELKFVCDCMP
jgi:hypothetical protein